jgi:hypothetical protein
MYEIASAIDLKPTVYKVFLPLEHMLMSFAANPYDEDYESWLRAGSAIYETIKWEKIDLNDNIEARTLVWLWRNAMKIYVY